MRARARLTDLDRRGDDRLGDDVPPVSRSWGKRGLLDGSPTHVIPMARRAAGQAAVEERDVVAERDQIKAVMRRAHHRRARRRPIVSWLA
jgi:hypothetical protein